MPVKKNYYTDVEGDPNKLPKRVRLEIAFDTFLDYNSD